MKLDKIDIKILVELQKDSRMSAGGISRIVGLSVTPCYRRIQRLKEGGIIGKEVVLLSRRKLGLNFEAHVEVKLVRSDALHAERFERLVNLYPEIIECFAVQGNVDFILKVITQSSAGFDHFLRHRLRESETISSTETFIIVNRVVDRQALPLEHVALKCK